MGWNAPKEGRVRWNVRPRASLARRVELFAERVGARSLNQALEELIARSLDEDGKLNREGGANLNREGGAKMAPRRRQDGATLTVYNESRARPERQTDKLTICDPTARTAVELGEDNDEESQTRKGGRRTEGKKPAKPAVRPSVFPLQEILDLWLSVFVEPWNASEPDRCRALARASGIAEAPVFLDERVEPSSRTTALLAAAWQDDPDLATWKKRFVELGASPWLVRDRGITDLFEVFTVRDSGQIWKGLAKPGRYRPRPDDRYYGLKIVSRETGSRSSSPSQTTQTDEELFAELEALRGELSAGLAGAELEAKLARVEELLSAAPEHVAALYRQSFDWTIKGST